MAHRVLLGALLIGVGARAEDRFGRHGQVVPFGSIAFQHSGGNGTDFNSVALFPGALWFAADNFALGGSVGYAHSWGGIVSTGHLLTVSPQVGVAIPLGDRAALFPRFGLDFLTFWNGGSSTSMAIRVFAPVLFFPVPHFFIGFGPQFEVIAGGNSAGQWLTGALSEIGGYF